MGINSYGLIGGVAAALLAVSLARERRAAGRLPAPAAVALRFAHLYAFSYVVLFAALFDAAGWDAVAYVAFCIFMSYHWILFGCCLLSLWELRTYGAPFGHLPTTHHPTMHSLFGPYDQAAMLAIGAVMIATLALILVRNRRMSAALRLACAAALALAIGYSQYASRVLGQTFYRGCDCR